MVARLRKQAGGEVWGGGDRLADGSREADADDGGDGDGDGAAASGQPVGLI